MHVTYSLSISLARSYWAQIMMFSHVYIAVIQLQSVSFQIYHNKLLLKNIIKLQWFSILGEKNLFFPNLRYADDTTLMAESEEELKNLLMKVKEESEKVGLKFNIQKSKIMASGPIISWQIDEETVADFIFGDGDYSHEITRRLLLVRKVMTNLDTTLKSRDITSSTKVHLVKAMVFPVVMYYCESWTLKKAECKELMLLNCGVGEDSWESLELQGDPTSPS